MQNRIERKGGKVTGNVPYFVFKEGDKYVAYSLALDLSTCGDTEKNARKMFKEVAQIFIDEIIEMGTFDDVLTECGWNKVTAELAWSPPTYKQRFAKIAVGAGA